MIYDMFPGLDTNYTDPAQKDVITTGWDIDDLVDRDISDLSDVWTSIMLRTSCQRFPRIGQSGTPPYLNSSGCFVLIDAVILTVFFTMFVFPLNSQRG